MVDATLGVVADDFNQIWNDFSRTVTYYIVTRTTSNITGTESDAYATGTSVTLVFFKQECRYIFDKEGLLLVGDAYIIAKTTVGVKRYDKILVDGEYYLVENVIRRYFSNLGLFDYAVLFRTDAT